MLLISRFYAGSLVLTACCEAASCHVASLLNFMQMNRLSQKTAAATTTTHLVCCLIWLAHPTHNRLVFLYLAFPVCLPSSFKVTYNPGAVHRHWQPVAQRDASPTFIKMPHFFSSRTRGFLVPQQIYFHFLSIWVKKIKKK